MRSRDIIYGLDFIRFSAAAVVLTWHLGYRFFDPSAPHIRKFVSGVPVNAAFLDGPTRFGWVGVEIFFVISGIVIAYSALRSDPWRFFVGRLGRLWPGVLAVSVLVLAINCLFWQWSVRSELVPLAKTLLFIPRLGWLMPQFWTLPVEIIFYFLVWLLIVSRRVDRLDSLALFLLLVSCVYWALVAAGIRHPAVGVDRLMLVQHAFYFAMGIVLCSLDRLGFSWGRVAILVAGVVLATVEIGFATQEYGVEIHRSDWVQPFAFWLFCVVLMGASLRYKAQIGRVISVRPWLGAASHRMGVATYPLYLCHIHVGGLFTTLAIAAGMAAVPAIVLSGLFCVVVAIAIATLVEPPLRRILVAVLDRLRARIAPPPAPPQIPKVRIEAHGDG